MHLQMCCLSDSVGWSYPSSEPLGRKERMLNLGLPGKERPLKRKETVRGR